MPITSGYPESKSGFGFTISKERDVDVDSNDFFDFAVGAPFAEKAVLLKTHAVISFEASSHVQKNLLLNPNEKGKYQNFVKSQK